MGPICCKFKAKEWFLCSRQRGAVQEWLPPFFAMPGLYEEKTRAFLNNDN
jgi:hypothetical protein